MRHRVFPQPAELDLAPGNPTVVSIARSSALTAGGTIVTITCTLLQQRDGGRDLRESDVFRTSSMSGPLRELESFREIRGATGLTKTPRKKDTR